MTLKAALVEGVIHARKTPPLIHAVTMMTKIKKRVLGR